jgi:hypothetical protein
MSAMPLIAGVTADIAKGPSRATTGPTMAQSDCQRAQQIASVLRANLKPANGPPPARAGDLVCDRSRTATFRGVNSMPLKCF